MKFRRLFCMFAAVLAFAPLVHAADNEGTVLAADYASASPLASSVKLAVADTNKSKHPQDEDCD